MEYSALEDLPQDTPLVGLSYSRDSKTTADMYARGQPWRPETNVTETMTFDVPADASVEIRVSTDARGTLRRIVHHAVSKEESMPAWSRRFNAPEQVLGYNLAATHAAPWSKIFPPALTFSVRLEEKDSLVHVSVTDLNDPKAAVSDRFIKLAEFRSPSQIICGSL
jgi:hypothetical protein